MSKIMVKVDVRSKTKVKVRISTKRDADNLCREWRWYHTAISLLTSCDVHRIIQLYGSLLKSER